jgi:hypothetical protein
MAKQHYFFKLIPPRPTFPQAMTDEERRLMDEHSRYFQEHFAEFFFTAQSWQLAGLSASPCWKSIARRRLGGLAKAILQLEPG